MAAEAEAWALAAVNQTPESFRRMLSRMFGDRPGILGATSWAVQQRGAGANMSVDVLAGAGIVLGSESAAQGAYFCQSLSTTNVTLVASEANPRRDIIVARVKDAQYSGAVNAFSLEVVKGTAAVSPVDPTLPADVLSLARITVSASPDSTIVTGDIADLRPRAAGTGGVVVCTSTTRPTVGLMTGSLCYETDTGLLYVQSGATWNLIGGQWTPWTTVSGGVGFQNSWVDYDAGASFNIAAFRKVGDIVFLRGLVKNGTVGNVIFTLPAGYRPLKQHLFAIDDATSAHGRIDVQTSGDVQSIAGDANGYLSLDTIQFSIS